MRKRIAEAVLLLGIAAAAADLRAAGYKTSCTATAGLAKHVPATSSTGTEPTGSFDVTITGGGGAAEVKVEPKRPVAAGDATKVAARIDRVLMRSPYKSEATALPTREVPGNGSGHLATFDLDAIRALPVGDLNIVVITPDGERVCRLDKSARGQLVDAR